MLAPGEEPGFCDIPGERSLQANAIEMSLSSFLQMWGIEKDIGTALQCDSLDGKSAFGFYIEIHIDVF